MAADQLFILSREDWSLHRKGYQDQQRHKDKVREAIKHNLPDLVADESIVMSGGGQVVRVPVKSMGEYRFVFNRGKSRHVGQGDGESKVGDVLGTEPAPGKGAGKGQGAGEDPGEDYTDAEITLDQVEELLFDELELPRLQQKQKEQMRTTDVVFHDVRKKGLMSNIDKKRTLIENLRRNALDGNAGIGAISPEDLRYRTWQETVKPQSNAVILALMDTSGSMGSFEKYCARSFFFWMTRFLRKKYEHVEIVYIAHHTEAKVVSEEDFFTRGESGGTICSSAYLKALELIDSRFPPALWNIYPFHFSDGDNLTSDNEKCVRLIGQLMDRCNLFGYGEVNQYNRNSTLMSAYKHISSGKFLYSIIREKGEVYAALKHFFSPGQPAG